MDRHVGQLAQLAPTLDRVVDGARRRRFDEEREQLARIGNVQQLGVGDGVACQLVGALRNL